MVHHQPGPGREDSRVHLAHVQSPASLAQALASLAHMAAPLAKFDLSEAEHESWAEAFHGGWCSAEPTICGESLQVASLDVSSCFPLMAHHLGWWDVMTAERLRRQDVTEDLRHFCADVAKDPTMALEPRAWAGSGSHWSRPGHRVNGS